MTRALPAALLFVSPICVAAGDLERAIQLLDQNEAKYCEIRTLKLKARRVFPGSIEHMALESKLRDVATEFEPKNQAVAQELDSLVKRMPDADVAKVYKHAMTHRQKCLAPLGPEPEVDPPRAVPAPPPAYTKPRP